MASRFTFNVMVDNVPLFRVFDEECYIMARLAQRHANHYLRKLFSDSYSTSFGEDAPLKLSFKLNLSRCSVGKTAAFAAEGRRLESSIKKNILKRYKFKFEPMSLVALLSVLPAFYDIFYFTISVIRDTVKMATMYTIKSLPMRHKQRTNVRFVLSHGSGTRESVRP